MNVWCGVFVSIVFDRRKVEKRSDGSLGKAGKWIENQKNQYATYSSISEVC